MNVKQAHIISIHTRTQIIVRDDYKEVGCCSSEINDSSFNKTKYNLFLKDIQLGHRVFFRSNSSQFVIFTFYSQLRNRLHYNLVLVHTYSFENHWL